MAAWWPLTQPNREYALIARFWGCFPLLAALWFAPSACLGWGAEGHKVIALIARAHLTPRAETALDALLAADPDTLTPPDMASRAVWADVWRNSHRDTGPWHYADLEIDGSNRLEDACARGDCLVDRLEAFETVLANPAAAQASRITALKFVLHLAGDLHQPLHMADNHDRGGNCLTVSADGGEPLHRYWDVDVVEAAGTDAKSLAAALAARIRPAQTRAWSQGSIRDWALETHQIAKRVAYALKAAPGCAQGANPADLPPGYAEAADRQALEQLEKAGVRLALLLNRALDPKAG